MDENREFWEYLNKLVVDCNIVVDRPRGSKHPDYEDLVYPLDYGYLEGTTTVDGGGVDIWIGSDPSFDLNEVVCTVDMNKKDIEVKLLLGCSPSEVKDILNFHNRYSMRALLITNNQSGKMRKIMSLELIPNSHEDLLADDTRAFAFLATSMPDGSLQVTPVWFNTDGGYILINSLKGCVKDKNMRARPTVALAIPDPDDPYRYLQIRGEVIEITEEGAEDHIHKLANIYLGEPEYKNLKPGDVRVTYKISPTSVTTKG